jgi:hypothetical protein
MSLRLFNLFEAADRFSAAPGWFGKRCLAPSSGTKQPYEVGPLRLPVERLSR